MTDIDHPRLRLIDAQPILYEGEKFLMLRDPLMLCENSILIPQPYTPILGLCDGSHTIAGIRASLALRNGIFLTTERITEFLAALDNAFLLENQRSQKAKFRSLAAFRQAEYRPPASAGASYPADPNELADYLQHFSDQIEAAPEKIDLQNCLPCNGRVRGLVSPHIDYERGGPVYAQVWGSASQAAQEADLAIIIGTDHFSEGQSFSLTRQNYATPFGILPTNTSIVDRLAEIIGEKEAYAGELHHRREHSIELAAVWLHYIRAGKPISLIPILTGSLNQIRQRDNGQIIENILTELKHTINGKSTLVIAAGDMAHVGPVFDGPPYDPGKLIQLKTSDDALIQAMCQGDAEGFYQLIEATQDANNICGVSPIYLALRLLYPIRGSQTGYAVCPADTQQTSYVSICGVCFH